MLAANGLCYTPIQPKFYHAYQYSIQFTCRVSRDGAGPDVGVILPTSRTSFYFRFRFISSLAYFPRHMRVRPSPAPPRHVTFPNHSVAQSQTTSHTSEQPDSSTICCTIAIMARQLPFLGIGPREMNSRVQRSTRGPQRSRQEGKKRQPTSRITLNL